MPADVINGTQPNLNEAQIKLIDELVYEKTGQSLNDLQRLVLSECWQTSKKTYEEIATENNYSSRYIQQRVAPSLWHLMSEIVGTKVTKSNCRSMLLRCVERTTERLTEKADSHDAIVYRTVEQHKFPFELPAESVPLGSPYYIQRKPYEFQCYKLIRQPGALIRIKAPRQMGKTSLMNRIINHAQDYKTAVVNFQQTDREIISDLDRLLRWLCANIARQLKLPPMLDDFWDEDIGSKMSCTLYLEEYILEQIDEPIILALEESSELFDYDAVSKDIFTMLRTWHEYTKHNETWENLRLILVQSTENYIPLNVNQSPFNVGFEVPLSPFTREQVSTLAKRSSIEIVPQTSHQLMDLLAGHPYLTRLALHHIARGSVDWESLFALASTDAGIFKEHLHRHLWNLQQHAELCIFFRDVLSQPAPMRVPQEYAFKLHSMGLVTLDGNQVQVSCGLYRQYFTEHL
ncbi:MAG: AAA-like domain-containing protein [Cyanobacteria bacterium J06560_6]